MRFAFVAMLVLPGALFAGQMTGGGQGGQGGGQGRAPANAPKTPGPGETRRQLPERQREIYAAVRQEAAALARWCESAGYAHGRERALAIEARFGGGSLHAPRPGSNRAARGADKAPEGYAKAAGRLAAAAGPLEKLLADAMAAGELGVAIECAQDMLAIIPDHKSAREALGHVFFQGRWLTPAGKRRLDAGMERDPAFGWVRAADVEKYRAGLRPVAGAGGEFVPAEQADRAHESSNNPYVVVSDHFTVYSCRPFEEGVAVAEEAEKVLEALMRLIPGFFCAENAAAGKPPAATLPVKPMRIFYAKDRRQYLEMGLPGHSKGLYDVGRAMSFFYPYTATETRVQMAIFHHEMTHQILDAFSPRSSLPIFTMGNRSANAWIVEGMATCMEG
ncbi:MAG: hypothetical protein N3A38_04690, partial [Planctomycetota bacterium]|nr:hypothetical protein [Planctomycetota bacterium]